LDKWVTYQKIPFLYLKKRGIHRNLSQLTSWQKERGFLEQKLTVVDNENRVVIKIALFCTLYFDFAMARMQGR